MHPRIQELLDYIETSTARLKSAFESVPEARRAERPAPDRWSPAENVHHVAIVERRLAQRLTGLAAEARAFPSEAETTTVLASINTAQVETRDRRFKTSEASTPTRNDAADAWNDLMDARRAVLAAITAADGVAFGQVSAPHPALGPFTGYEWIAFVGSHAARHADQIREGEATRLTSTRT